jgi:hypothetical protein
VPLDDACAMTQLDVMLRILGDGPHVGGVGNIECGDTGQDLEVRSVFHHDLKDERFVFHSPIVSGGWERRKGVERRAPKRSAPSKSAAV